MPTSVPGIEPHLLYPMGNVKDDKVDDEEVRMFHENFVKYEKHVDADVRCATPRRGGGRQFELIVLIL